MDNSLVSQGSSNVMCSHEKINVEFNISSSELNNESKEKYPKQLGNGFNIQDLNVPIKDSQIFHSVKKIKLNAVTSDLFSSDDSLLENLDLSFKENNEINNFNNDYIERKSIITEDTIDFKCFPALSTKQKYALSTKSTTPDILEINKSPQTPNEKLSKSKDCIHSPDIFNSNRDDTAMDENDENEDQAWDMSISIAEAKDKSFNDDCETVKNIPVSQGLSSLVFSTWVKSSPERTTKVTTFEDLLKNTLKNNAHKTVVRHSSPRSLFSDYETICKEKDSFFGLTNNVKSLIKRFKGITNLYGKDRNNKLAFT